MDGFEPRSVQTKDYTIGISYFSVKHTTLKNESEDLATRNREIVSAWSDMPTNKLSFQWANHNKNRLGVLCYVLSMI